MSDQRAGWLLVIVSGALAHPRMPAGVRAGGGAGHPRRLIERRAGGDRPPARRAARHPDGRRARRDRLLRQQGSAGAHRRRGRGRADHRRRAGRGRHRRRADGSACLRVLGGSGGFPGPFDCAALNSDTPAEMQAALDELDHGSVEIYFAADDSCAAMLPGVTPAEAIGSYVPQLEAAGWRIEQNSPEWLEASRGGYQLWVVTCFPDSTQPPSGSSKPMISSG